MTQQVACFNLKAGSKSNRITVFDLAAGSLALPAFIAGVRTRGVSFAEILRTGVQAAC